MSEKRLLVKHPGEEHFTKTFPDGSTSRRVVLPDRDGTVLKVTDFRPKKGFFAPDINYTCDETVYVGYGRIRVWQDTVLQTDSRELSQGDIYIVPAGVHYGLEALEYSVLVCVFSQVLGGPPVDSE